MTIMTTQLIKDICRERELYESPELNTKLYLQFRGFRKIEALDPYLNVKALFLENNAIDKIENLERLRDLVCLYLQQNQIGMIENLTFNVKIKRLNLSCNNITKIENIKHLQVLEELNLSHNKLTRLSDELHDLPHLTNCDLSFNEIETSEEAITFFARMQPLRQLKYSRNPGARHICNYRQRIINELPHLSYLDDRPVFEVERVSAKAWQEGGRDAERLAKARFVEKQQRAPPTDDWEERKYKVSERMRRALQRPDSAEEEKTMNETPVPAPVCLYDDWDHLEEYSQEWKSRLKKDGPEKLRTEIAIDNRADKAILNMSSGDTSTVVQSEKLESDSSDDFCKVQFDDAKFHQWQQKQWKEAVTSAEEHTRVDDDDNTSRECPPAATTVEITRQKKTPRRCHVSRTPCGGWKTSCRQRPRKTTR
eukprot:GEMP01034854.1.p1 GENE.GEMP01034854.1~~GEMP01034854.1.p1  ORF type:complete len:424 (+),score=108.49 GEMP01034854.1:95-1366(+)